MPTTLKRPFGVRDSSGKWNYFETLNAAESFKWLRPDSGKIWKHSGTNWVEYN